jgi:predicted phosphoribosyltransferase
LPVIHDHHPRELIVAVPICAADRIEELRRHCDDVVCVLRPAEFGAVGAFYRDFREVSDEEVRQLLRQFAPGSLAVLGGEAR